MTEWALVYREREKWVDCVLELAFDTVSPQEVGKEKLDYETGIKIRLE